MNLRDQTRVVEQTRGTIEPHEFEQAATGLGETQGSLRDRVQAVVDRLEELQETDDKNFGKALQRLGVAKNAMGDATELLTAAETGGPAMAAETEAIEALLITKRGGGGGAGGGDTPGGGTGTGAANEEASALAGIGEGFELEDRTVAQSMGNDRTDIPDEFRAGLDAYFGAIDGQSSN